MSWRTIVISNRCKLDLKMGCMVVRSEDTQRVLLDEISVIIVENPAVAITGCLLNEIARKKIKLIFCDEKHEPLSELMPLYGSHDCSAKIRLQMEWSDELKAVIWTAIVSEKIRQQSEHLRFLGHDEDADKLKGYIAEIELGDESNREGHAAKVYFNSVFGVTFSRNSPNATNAALNYGYSIILSAVNREICACGYLTQIGLFHDNMFNQFNLGCDLMEPFRPIVDRFVKGKRYTQFDSRQKHELLSIMKQTVLVEGAEQYLLNAIKLYIRSVFEALNECDASRIRFYKLIDGTK